MKNIITINGVSFEVSAEIATSILTICSSMGKSVKTTTKAPKAKAEPKPTTTKANGKSVKVIKVDKYGNQWIAQYDAAKYATKKAEMITNGTYDPKNRSKVYKELGWIL